jgi:hypothetical protein
MKPGWKTTEFWLSALVILTGLLMASGMLTPDSRSGQAVALVQQVAAAAGGQTVPPAPQTSLSAPQIAVPGIPPVTPPGRPATEATPAPAPAGAQTATPATAPAPPPQESLLMKLLGLGIATLTALGYTSGRTSQKNTWTVTPDTPPTPAPKPPEIV